MLINKVILVIILSVLFYVSIAIFSDIKEFIKELQNANLIFLPLILALIFASNAVKGFRQHIILKKIGINISKTENMKLFLSSLSMLVTPGGSGEMIKSHFLQKHNQHSVAKTLPVFFVERYHDFLAIVIFLCLTLIIFDSLVTKIIVLFSSTLVLTVFLFVSRGKWLLWLQSKIQKIKPFKNLFKNKDEFNNSLFILYKPTIIGKLVLVSALSVLLESFAVYFGFLSILPKQDFVESIQIFYTSILTGLFSFLPAGIGVTEGSMIGLLLQKKVAFSQASSVVLFIRLTTLWYATAIGFIFLKTMIKRNKTLQESNNH